MFRQKRTREQIPEEQDQEENEVEEPPAKMRRSGVRFDWPANPEMTFDSKDECEAFIASEKTWKFIRNRGTKDGFRGGYQCDKVKARGENCAGGICTRFGKGHGDAAYELYRLPNAHNHDELDNKVTALSPEVKEILIKLLDDGKTLLKILDVIRQMDNIVQPRKNQVESFIKAYRRARFGAAKMTVQQFVDWAIAYSDIPDDIDKAFVLAYEHSPLGDYIPDDEDETTIVPWIRIIVSTKRLLVNSSQSKIIHADGTYKLNIQKYPVLVFGTTDLDSTQHFHLLALMLCKTEATDDFEFGFKAVSY